MGSPTHAASVAVFVSAFAFACAEGDRDRSNSLEEAFTPAEMESGQEPPLDARTPPHTGTLDAAKQGADLDAGADTRDQQPETRDASKVEPDAQVAWDAGAMDAQSSGDTGPAACTDCRPDGFHEVALRVRRDGWPHSLRRQKA